MKVIVEKGQTLFDLAIRWYGNIEDVDIITRLNPINITDVLRTGQEIEVGKGVSNFVTNFLAKKQINPNSNLY